MKRFAINVLKFLRLVNGDGCLSISNIAVIVVLVKVALEPTLDLASAATLLTVIGGYNWKRYIVTRHNNKKEYNGPTNPDFSIPSLP